MKQSFFTFYATVFSVIFSLTSFNSHICKGQYVDFPEPEWENEILYVNHRDKKLQELERQEAISDQRQSAGMQLTGITNIKTKLKVKGGSSNVEVKPFFGRYQFVYKVENNKLNPKDLVRLYEWKTAGRFREILIAQISTTGSKAGYGNPVSFRAQKYKESSYLITIENLPPGEYGFSIGKERSATFTMFSIRGGKEDLLKIEELPLFNDFFEDRISGRIDANSKVYISMAPGSKDLTDEMWKAIKMINSECVNSFEEATVYLEYFYGKFARFGPQGRGLQIRVVNAKNESEIAAISRDVSGEGLGFSEKMEKYLANVFTRDFRR